MHNLKRCICPKQLLNKWRPAVNHLSGDSWVCLRIEVPDTAPRKEPKEVGDGSTDQANGSNKMRPYHVHQERTNGSVRCVYNTVVYKNGAISSHFFIDFLTFLPVLSLPAVFTQLLDQTYLNIKEKCIGSQVPSKLLKSGSPSVIQPDVLGKSVEIFHIPFPFGGGWGHDVREADVLLNHRDHGVIGIVVLRAEQNISAHHRIHDSSIKNIKTIPLAGKLRGVLWECV